MIATSMKSLRLFLALFAVGAALPVEAADPPSQVKGKQIMLVNCPAAGMNSYTLQRGDTCQSIASNPRFHFGSYRQVELINKPLSGFTCANARAGQIICYPRQ